MNSEKSLEIRAEVKNAKVRFQASTDFAQPLLKLSASLLLAPHMASCDDVALNS